MANQVVGFPKAEKYPYPSRYATHASMVDKDMTEKMNDLCALFNVPKMVVCKDEHGFYITEKNRVDSGIADPNRYANSAARKIPEGLVDNVQA